MRHLLQLLTLLALLVAPLAAPAAALSAGPVLADCTGQAMDVSGHSMPAADHGTEEACCIAVPPAIDPPLAEYASLASSARLGFAALAEPFRLGTGPSTDDPPPRFA